MAQENGRPAPASRQKALPVTLPLLLLTRPRAQSERFAQQCLHDCPPHHALIAPLTEIVPVPLDPASFEGADEVILTSPNAVPAVRNLGLPAWCVGPGTALAARAAGLSVRESGGDAAHLLDDLRKAGPGKRWVHAHGLHMARDLTATLAPKGFDIRGVVVYEARACVWGDAVVPTLVQAARVVVPIFSPRAAALIVEQLGGRAPERLQFIAISANAAARLPAPLRARCTIAEAPNAAAMRHAIAEGLSHPPPEP